MISTHFSLSVLIIIDMFFPESVVCKLMTYCAIFILFYFILFLILKKHVHVAAHNIIWVLR